MYRSFIILLLLLVTTSPQSQLLEQQFHPVLFHHIKRSYGGDALIRAKKWQKVVDENKDNNEWQQLNKINNFFNLHVQYQTDNELWGQKDYWASPVETIGLGKGDCEDYAIAKLFSLVSTGIPENKLRLMYVRQLSVNEPHMVLIYFEKPDSIPLVLDNFNSKILPANKRRDLKPIYSFNAEGLWLAKTRGMGKKANNSTGVSAWDKLLERIDKQSFPAS